MTPRQIELARHALGLTDKRQKQSYRNYFVAGKSHDDYEEWEAMVRTGMALKRSGKTRSGVQLFGGDDIFHLTPAGAIASVRKGESLDPEDFPQ